MKTIVVFALAAFVAASAAHAKSTPRDGLAPAPVVDVTALYGGPIGAEMERNYFSAAATESVPAQRAGRCTARIILFEKVRLAQACY